MLVDFKMDKCR